MHCSVVRTFLGFSFCPPPIMLTHLLAWAIVAPGLVAYGKAPGRGACTLEELYEPSLSPATEIASSTEANFSTVVGARWSAWEAPRWSGAIKPATEADLQKIVSLISSYLIVISEKLTEITGPNLCGKQYSIHCNQWRPWPKTRPGSIYRHQCEPRQL